MLRDILGSGAGMKKTTILIVDDEPRLVRFVKANLESVGYKVLSANDGNGALNLVQAEQPDLVILDILMPEMDGFQVCENVRQFSDVPIVFLTARTEESDKVRGFDLGADDYLTKPFGADELLARVNAVLRRTRFREEPRFRPNFVCDDLEIDFAHRKVFVRGDEVSLSPTEYKLLCQLAINSKRVMLHEELLSRVWGPDYRGEIEYLRVYIRYLRQKIEADSSHPRYILSKPGVGYMFAEPTAASL